jgi:selenide, water dikinase
LQEILDRLVPGSSNDLMVGFETADDAAVYRMSDDTALLLTVDFFTPIVDDPYDFGRITAANALSDIYAMGGRPLTVMNLLAFPCSLGPDVIAEVLRGGADVTRESGAVVVGGHTIEDKEPKFGLSVMGVVHPDHVVRNVGAQPGDVIVMTKALGTGVIATAIKRGLEQESTSREFVEGMARLNRAAGEAMVEAGVSAGTDITGFGLLGHLHEMALGSGVAAEIQVDSVPLYKGALEYSQQGVRPGRTADILTWLADFTEWRATTDAWQGVLADPQTSGGMLVAVAPDRADVLLDALEARGEAGAVIGFFCAGEPGAITVG